MRYDVAFHPSWFHKHAGVDFSQPFWDDPQTRIKADITMRRTLWEKFGRFGLGEENPQPRPLLGSDELACGYLFSEMLGCEIRYKPDDSPQVVCARLDDDACFALEAPDFETSGVWRRTQEQIDALRARFGRVETYVNLMGVQNIAMDLRGSDLLADYYDEESPAAHLLDVACATMLEGGKRLTALTPRVSAGVTNVVRHVCPDVFLTSNCSVEMVSRETYEQMLLPHDERLARAFAPFGIHHCGQTAEHVVQAYARVPNLAFFESGAGSDLAKVRDALPPNVQINQRVSPVRMAAMTDEQIRTEIAGYQAILPDGRLSVSVAGVDGAMPDSRIEAFLSACREILDA